jgi:hypothetical protein
VACLSNCATTRHPGRVPDPRVSVLVELPDQLETLNSQTCANVELITWNDDDWAAAAADIAARHDWAHVRVANRTEAIEHTTASYVVGWDAVRARPSALVQLLEAAERETDTRGALAANFDPLILWRREEFFGRTHRQGLAQASAIAIGGIGGTQVHPPVQRAPTDA